MARLRPRSGPRVREVTVDGKGLSSPGEIPDEVAAKAADEFRALAPDMCPIP